MDGRFFDLRWLHVFFIMSSYASPTFGRGYLGLCIYNYRNYDKTRHSCYKHLIRSFYTISCLLVRAPAAMLATHVNTYIHAFGHRGSSSAQRRSFVSRSCQEHKHTYLLAVLTPERSPTPKAMTPEAEQVGTTSEPSIKTGSPSSDAIIRPFTCIYPHVPLISERQATIIMISTNYLGICSR